MSSADNEVEGSINEAIKFKREAYNRIYDLLGKVEVSSPLLINAGLRGSFLSKLHSLEIMQNYTIEKSTKLYDAYLKEKADQTSIVPKDINAILPECVAFFEAYLNTFYSLLQVIAKATPYFYDVKKLKKKIPVDYFEKQSKFFLDNGDIDAEYTQYLMNHMNWYADLVVCNRHAVSHNVSVFIGFGKQEIEFIHMPHKTINYFENGKPLKKLRVFIVENWDSLFDFLDFYAKHFTNFQIFSDKEEELKKLQELISKV